MNFPEPTLFLDISDIKRWGLLTFLLSFFLTVLIKRGTRKFEFYSYTVWSSEGYLLVN